MGKVPEMRRKEKRIENEAAVAELLDRAAVCRLGFSAAAGLCDYPYVVPVHFAHHEGAIYVHCARTGLKLELLHRDPRVCVEVDELGGIVPAQRACSFATRYASAIGFGRAEVVSDAAVRGLALDLLMRKYGGPEHARGEAGWDEKELERLSIIAVQLEHLSGKRAGEA